MLNLTTPELMQLKALVEEKKKEASELLKLTNDQAYRPRIKKLIILEAKIGEEIANR